LGQIDAAPPQTEVV